jgi:hypothetical protein
MIIELYHFRYAPPEINGFQIPGKYYSGLGITSLENTTLDYYVSDV